MERLRHATSGLCIWIHLKYGGRESTPPAVSPEPVFVNIYKAQESIPLAYVAWQAGTTNRVVVPARQAGNRFLGFLKGLQIQSQHPADPWGGGGGLEGVPPPLSLFENDLIGEVGSRGRQTWPRLRVLN
jgi:hypothetical protein